MADKLQWKWIGTGLLATGVMLSPLILIDQSLERLGVSGVFALQQARDGAAFQKIIDAWQVAGSPALVRAGFSLGWDYLFLTTYGIVFVLGGLRARHDLFPSAGIMRSLALAAVFMMVAGALLDATENVFQLKIAAGGVSDGLAHWSSMITIAKWVLVKPCMLLTLVGAANAARHWWTRTRG